MSYGKEVSAYFSPLIEDSSDDCNFYFLPQFVWLGKVGLERMVEIPDLVARVKQLELDSSYFEKEI